MATKLTMTVWQSADGSIFDTEEAANNADQERANDPRALLRGVLDGDPDAVRRARALLDGPST